MEDSISKSSSVTSSTSNSLGSGSEDLSSSLAFSNYHKFVIVLLVFLQFTIVLDFMIMAPLGALIMGDFKISPTAFGKIVSVYAFSAGLSGLLASAFADKFDRKKLLLFFYIGFVLGTLFCAMANNYNYLFYARLVTGLFGGVIGSIVMAITTDLFQLKQRSQVLGYVQTAMGASQILGIPAGLYLSNIWSWHAPFYLIVIISLLVGFFIVFNLKPIDAHLKLQKNESPLIHVFRTFKSYRNLIGFAATALITIGGYLLMPFTSAFTVHNLGIPMEKLPFIYLSTGIFAIICGPIIGRMCIRFSAWKVFQFGALVTIIMVLIYTHLQQTPLYLVILVNILFFIGIFSRIIPSQTMISAIPDAAHRGSFMAVNSSMQQISGGVAALFSGLIVYEQIDGKLAQFPILGYILTVTVLLSIYFVRKIHLFTAVDKN